MTLHSDTGLAELRSASADVPLSERPLVADDQNTVITSPDRKRVEVAVEVPATVEATRQRLFPSGGTATGDECGVRLEHFEIRERIGAGGMGAVFRATDLELARDVALKIMHPVSSSDQSLIARFRNEARACAQLNHDNIARVFYSGSQDGLYFIAYEFANGRTIKELIQQHGRLTPAETVNYAIQVSLALNHIAAAGIVHRDIKPSNIILTENGRVKVVDLGLARRDTTDSIGDITVAGTTLGTFDYIAPEQARDPRSADIRSDIYSLGCTMYHMLTGQPPYPDGTALQKLLDHQGKSPPDPRSINGAIPPELAAVMRKMMANHPSHRYQAPGLLLSDLIQLAQLMGLQSIPAEGIVWRKLDTVRTRQPMGAIWLFASVAVICATALVLRSIEETPPGSSVASIGEESPGIEYTPVSEDGSVTNGTKTLSNSGLNQSATSGTAAGTTTSAVPPTNGNSTETKVAGNGTSVAGDRVMYPVPIISAGPVAPALMEIDVEFPRVTGDVPLPVENSGPFLLQAANGPGRPYKTLQGAVANAKSGDVILLRFNGYPADIPAQPPIRITGMNLIIRAADGFRPTLEFEGSTNGALPQTEMFILRTGGSVTIRDVDLRLVVREELNADHWSMFRLDGPNQINLNNVTLDVVNPKKQSVSLFELPEVSAGGDAATTQETSIKIERCLCRGNADGILISSQPQGQIQMQNTAFAIGGPVIRNFGSAGMPQGNRSLDVSILHGTFVLDGPFLELRDSDELSGRGPQRSMSSLNLTSEACVFASVVPGETLIVSAGNGFIEELESAINWNGFNNLYSQFNVLWQIETAAMDLTTRRLDLNQWKQFWQNRSTGEETNPGVLGDSFWVENMWITSGAMDYSAVTSDSFELEPVLFQSNGGSLPPARDGLAPGVIVEELPAFPLAVKSKSATSGSTETPPTIEKSAP
ncbi:MAG: serine/threonine protein kinase [Planctomyces sp.]|nr:serine/threonine protein kinase [Planctomyces sp.]